MSIEQTDISPMDLLGPRLRELFPEITGGKVSGTYYTVQIASGVQPASFMKAFDGFVKAFLAANGDKDTSYQFKIEQDEGSANPHLVNFITYNDPDSGYHVEVLADGELHRLFVVDVLGATGDYSVYNSDFEVAGFMNMKAVQGSTEPDYGDSRPFPNFSDPLLWEAKGELVETYLNQILGQISLQIETAYRKGNVNIEDEGDLVYYPSVFGVSVEELKAGVAAVGASIGALEDNFRTRVR
jgi:hypothetical protein